MSESLPDPSTLSGMDQFRLMLEGKVPPAPIAASMGFDLVEVSEGYAVFEGVPTQAFYNPLGGVHGGWMATLLDSACGCVVHSLLKPGQSYATLELKTAFHKGLKAGIKVRAEGRIVQMGRRAAYSEATLKGEDGTLFASATSTCLVMAVA
jgi:uncharacterized domain 1